MGILNKDEICRRIRLEDFDKRIIVTPILDEASQIGAASIDVRLGSSIIIPKKVHVDQQDITNPQTVKEVEQRLYEKIRLQYHSKFMLHPNQLILGVTFEYLYLPRDVACQIMSRSSWGRLGLVVATAAMVQPGYRGCITLELVNLSESPLALYPGLPVGQFVFHQLGGDNVAEPYSGRYECPTEAEPPKFYARPDQFKDLEFWGKSR